MSLIQKYLDEQKSKIKINTPPPPIKLTYEEKYYKKVEKLPSVHPLHPYTVYLSGRTVPSTSVIVSATSCKMAELAGTYYANSFNKRKIKYDNCKAIPLIPIEKNIYWDEYNAGTNPDCLKLADYLKEQ